MDREWYSDDPKWQESHRDTDSAKAEQRAAKDYREKQEKAQQARDLSTQAAMDEKLAGKKQIAIRPIKGYDENENAWDWFTKGSNLYSPYQEVWDSLSKKPESHLKTITEWLLKNPNYYSPHDEKWSLNH